MSNFNTLENSWENYKFCRKNWPTLFVYMRGTMRLIKILLGVGAENSHSAAAHLLLALTFVVEGYLLHRVLMRSALNVLKPTFLTLPAAGLVASLIVIAILLLTSLFFHQLMIFRNFSISDGGTSPADNTQETNVSEQVPGKNRRRLIKSIEISIYLIFGILTGEAGYMLTALKEQGNSAIQDWFCRILGYSATGAAVWGEILEGLFLLSGVILCLLVLAWDFVVYYTPEVKKDFTPGLMRTFFYNDIFSCSIWVALCTISVPRLENFRLWGTFLLVCGTLLYIQAIGTRMKRGLYILGKNDLFKRAIVNRV